MRKSMHSMRKSMHNFVALAVIVVGLAAGRSPAIAQERSPETQSSYSRASSRGVEEVRPFQAWVEDAMITPGIDVEPFLNWGDYDFANVLEVGARAALWSVENLETGARLSFLSFDFANSQLDGESGISDINLYGRYMAKPDNPRIAVGGSFDLPIGSEEVGGESFDFSVFGAMRYRLENDFIVLANLGVESLEPPAGDRNNGIMLGGGLLMPATDELSVVTEFNIRDAGDFVAVTGGVDYRLPPGGHLRGAIQIGLDDGAADLQLLLGFLIPVY